LAIEQPQEFLVQPVDASWLQCNIECQEACPVGTNCRGYLNLAAEGRFEEGYILSREPNPVAAMCSYVCSAPCERACRRGDIDRPLAIRAMKRFLVEWHEASGIPDVMPQITPREERVAIVGAGPAGISVARELATKGYQVTVFDSLPYAGGTMLIGVPAFRLPREAIEMDVRLVERLGARFIYDTTIGVDITFDQLQRDFDVVAITGGAMDAVALDIPGAELDGVQYGVDFMKKANLGQPLEVGSDVVVIGGGYTAMDCSRTSLRHGSERVSIVYRRTRSELVVDEEELGETEREGVRMEFLASPVEILGKKGKVTGVKFIRNRLGEPDASGRRSPVPIEGSEFVIPAQTVIPAVSQAADLTFLPVEAKFEINRGRVKVDPATYASNVKGVFACGDFVTGPTTLIEAARARQEVRLRDRPLPVGTDRRDGGGQRQDHQLVAPRHARVLRRPAPPAHPDGAADGADALGRARRQLQYAGRARLRRQWRGRRIDPLPDVQLQHLVRSLPLCPVRGLRGCLPRGRHPHGRYQHPQVRRRPAGARRGLRLGQRRRDDPR